MNKYFRWFPLWGLIPRTAFTIGWMAIAAGVIALLLTTEVTRNRAERNAERELGELLDAIERTVSIACFVRDRVLAEEVARGILKNSKVLGVVIRAGDAELARSYRFSPRAEEVTDSSEPSSHTPKIGRLTRLVVSPFNQAEIVGEIHMDPDPAAIARHAESDVRFVGLMFGVQWLVVGIALLVLVLRSVVRPIQMISAHLHAMNAEEGERLATPMGHEHTEIGRLVADINALASRFVAVIERATGQAHMLKIAKEQVDIQADQLKRQNAALARAIKIQEEVERIARHDLKTPLGSIAAVPALLRRTLKPSDEEESLLAMIENSAKRVLRMVSLSLDMFRMEEGGYYFSPKNVDISALVRTVVSDLREESTAKYVRFRLIGCEAPVFVYAEETLCYSIIANLARNAIEATPSSMDIEFAISVDQSMVHLKIRNRGAVPDPVRMTFFDKYSTFGKSRGTGLGTYSARLMARVQCGDLNMETSDETDSTTLTLSLRAPELNKSAEIQEGIAVAKTGNIATLPELRILLVDDDPDNTLIMKLYLPRPPLVVETAANGREAVELCCISHPDVIFMDLEMPIMDGFDALRRIRELQNDRGEMPSKIIAFSAHDDEASRQRSLMAGFDFHLSKPTTQHEILGLLAGGTMDRLNDLPHADRRSNAVIWVDQDILDAIPGFIKSRLEIISELRSTVATGSRESLRALAHKLKGSFSMYGFNWAAQISREIEDCYLNADIESLTSNINALEHHLAHVKVRLRPQQSENYSIAG